MPEKLQETELEKDMRILDSLTCGNEEQVEAAFIELLGISEEIQKQ